MPASLGDRGRLFWTDLLELGRDFYTDTDRVALLDYCKMRDLEGQLEALVDAEGPTVIGSQGQSVANPNLRALLDVRKELRSAGKDLALNPRDRVVLGMQVKAGVDLLDELRAQSNASVSS